MEIHDYITLGGKNLIREYISTRPMEERRELYKIRKNRSKYFNIFRSWGNIKTKFHKETCVNIDILSRQGGVIRYENKHFETSTATKEGDNILTLLNNGGFE